VDLEDVHRGHVLTPRFLLDQIERSRRNLGLATLDYYLIQEPEIHLRALGVDGFRRALVRAFEALESAVSRGWIGAYGLATWDGFLLPDSDRSHLSIVDLFEIALEVGQAEHHLRAIQLPYGLAMGEGRPSRASSARRPEPGDPREPSRHRHGGLRERPALRRPARRPGSGLRPRGLPRGADRRDCGPAITRSTAAITTAVVGMRDPAHVAENMALARIPRARPEVSSALFSAAKNPEDPRSGLEPAEADLVVTQGILSEEEFAIAKAKLLR